MTLTTEDCLDAITRYSTVFAEAAQGNLDARVEHCPDWSVADLVWHLTSVHWFWATIAEGTLAEPPDEALRPARPDDDALIETFAAGARRLVEVLEAADQTAACWTWAEQKDVAFITRHQVQEAAVHAWDAAHAAGRDLEIDGAAAADAVDEFLAVSLPTEADAQEEELPALDGRFGLRSVDTGDSWLVQDGAVPGSVAASYGVPDGTPTTTASAADLLLWLYGRREVPLGDVPADLASRFRNGSFTG
ncbi:maleylpyruvate isomerase family mycothiol-dependent enzyme [Nocardioides mesophilus]|uniref:Maleylpyruvate isomerase family mycothiol-dependent enzyme n=1 Tax=Nocardioides mesophilus TaxID=433659 RepID=A0A7G9RB84_9ACTN|nr:maleylpyruvate isomerase family mycothiol-dependent enzyme [Nocardioides mesophilus]QNN52859.1 maleylpyruvate isomerase family mycothiol-dependent enzyme [Nocardioides mesophilus]